MFGKSIPTFLFLLVFCFANAQEIIVDYTLGQNNSDRYKYSTVLNISGAENGQTVLVRTYYGGMPLRPKGHFIELYDADLNLIEDYNNRYAVEGLRIKKEYQTEPKIPFMQLVDLSVKANKLGLSSTQYNNYPAVEAIQGLVEVPVQDTLPN